MRLRTLALSTFFAVSCCALVHTPGVQAAAIAGKTGRGKISQIDIGKDFIQVQFATSSHSYVMYIRDPRCNAHQSNYWVQQLEMAREAKANNLNVYFHFTKVSGLPDNGGYPRYRCVNRIDVS